MSIREFFERYGATVAIIVTIAFMGLILPGNSGGASPGSIATETGGTVAVPTGGAGVIAPPTRPSVGGAAAGTSGNGGTSTVGATGTDRAPAPASGTTSWTGSEGPGEFPLPHAGTSCRDDGALQGLHMAWNYPCIPVFDANNGGATSRGVTAGEILIVRYDAPVDPATQAALQGIGAADEQAVVDRSDDALMAYFATHFETYGRQPRWVKYSAVGSSEEAQRAAAVEIAEELQPFMVWNAPLVAAQELAARGIVCQCQVVGTTTQNRQFYADNFPYIWGAAPELSSSTSIWPSTSPSGSLGSPPPTPAPICE